MSNKNYFLGVYLKDNPELKLVKDCPLADVLLWAESKRKISLRRFDGEALYTNYQLEDAKMWVLKLKSGKSLLEKHPELDPTFLQVDKK